MTETDLYKELSRFEAALPQDCSGCETIHNLQTFVCGLVDRFDRRCDDHCDSRCVYREQEGGEATA